MSLTNLPSQPFGNIIFKNTAFVTVVTDIISAIQFNLLITHKLSPQNMRPHLYKIIIASTVIGVGVWVTTSLHLFIRIGFGVLIYCAMILILRLPDDTEKMWTRDGIQRLGRFLQGKKTKI
jgi:hypothetical protein